MARVSAAKKLEQRKRRRSSSTKTTRGTQRTPTTVVNVTQTLHAQQPKRASRSRQTKTTQTGVKKPAGGGGGGLGGSSSITGPARMETVMKIPATLATNQQAMIEGLKDQQKRQDTMGNVLMAAMLARPQPQIQQAPEPLGLEGAPPDAPVTGLSRRDFYPPRTHRPERIQIRRAAYERIHALTQNAARTYAEAGRWVAANEPNVEFDDQAYYG